MNKKRVVINLFLAVFTLTIVCASFEIGDISHGVSSVYGPSADLKGWVNLSFDDEPVDSVFEDSLGNSITLGELANKSSGYDYSCSTKNCISDYSSSNPEPLKSFDLDNREFKIVGLKFSGEITSIDSIDFVVESDANSSCYNQLTIDVLNDGVIDFGNNKPLADVCSFLKSYGCFNETEDLYTPAITNVPYCQRVSVFESPGIRLGAWILEEQAGDKELTMALYDIDGELKETCLLSKQNLSSGGEAYCDIDYLVTKSEDYYVCIYSDSGTGEYRTRGYSSSSNCGFNGFPKKQETSSYHIFAQAKSFAAVGILNVTDSISDGNTLSSRINNYILERYGSFDCSGGCVIPIKLISGANQYLTISGLKAVHSKPGLTGIIETNFYELDETPSKLNAGFQKLYLNEGGFKLPSEYGSIDFILKFNDEEIFTEPISVEDVPLIGTIYPSTTASAFPTLFIVPILNNDSVNFEWDFGDNQTATTTTNQATHTYSSSGDYALRLTVTDSSQRISSKTFQIKVVSPKELINLTLAKKTNDLKNVKSQISKFNSFYQERLDSFFDFESLDGTLKKLQRAYGVASSESEYNKIMTDLINFKVPELVLTTKSANSILSFPKEEYIDLYILETVGGGSYDVEDTDKYLNSILVWNHENLNTKITFKEISARYDSYDEPVMKFFEIDVSGKQEWDSDPYFIMRKLDDLSFDKDYSEADESGFVYFELEEDKTIAFSTTEDVDFTDLPFFLSPKISALSLKKPISVEEEETFSKWILFISIMFLLLVIGLITYIVLQRWYKNKYETYLFKNRNNLYNLVVYIQTSRKKGLEDKFIYSKLRKAGWSSEQTNYAMKKYAGERTGMFELPIGRVLDKLKKKGVLDKNRNSKIFGNKRNGFIR